MVAKKNVYTAEKYIRDVSSGKIVACKWVKLAVKRHLDELKKAGKKNFPYHFDSSYAEKTIDFIQLLEHTKGEFANKALHPDIRIKLEPWQQFIIWMLEGWRRPDGMRRFTRAYIEVARKNGKTTFAAGYGNKHFFADSPREIGPEIYFAATKQQQAKIAWEEAERQILRNPELRNIAKTYRSKNHIVIPSTAAIMRPLGRDSKTEDGLNPSMAVIDEYHAHPDASMVEVLESGMGAREQPLMLFITTAGTNYTGPCFEEHEHLQKMLEGSIPPVDNYWGIIFTLDEGDDWKDKKNWIKANPNLGVSVKEKYLDEQVKLAISSTTKIKNVKTKNLNIWCQSVLNWISDEKWKACGKVKYTEEELRGRKCFGAADLSSTQDITALCLSFPPERSEKHFKHLYRFYLPEDLISEKEDLDKVPYRAWIDQGYIFATPGNVIDYDFIEADIMQWAEVFNIVDFAYDPWHAQEVINHLTEAGLEMTPIRQGFQMMSPMCEVFEKKVLSKELAHGNNPVMRWMMSCVEMKSDRQGNIMPMKPKRGISGKRIDGAVANIMALGIASIGAGDKSSVYEERGVLAF